MRPRPHSPPICLLAAALAVLGACSPARTVESARLLHDIAAAAPPAPEVRREIAYAGAERTRRADLYRPERARAALIVVPGATEAARADPRLAAFAEALRRRGFLVMVPELDGEDALQVSAGDAGAVADAVRHLTGPGRFAEVGLAAPSYAAGPAIIAALEPEIAPRVGLIVAIGGYHDIEAAITYLVTGAFRDGPDAPWQAGPVDARAKWLFLRANAGRLGDAGDAAALSAIAEARLADPAAETAARAADLGPEGRAVHRLFASRDPDRVPALLAALPPALGAEIAALDLAARDLSRIEADLVLIHGRADPLVPWTESRALAAAAPAGRASLHLIDGLDHVDLGAPGPGDLAALLAAAYRVLAARDAAARGPEPGEG